MKNIRKFYKNHGQVIVEYFLIGACVAIGLIAALGALKPELFKNYFKSTLRTQGTTISANGQMEMPDMAE